MLKKLFKLLTDNFNEAVCKSAHGMKEDRFLEVNLTENTNLMKAFAKTMPKYLSTSKRTDKERIHTDVSEMIL